MIGHFLFIVFHMILIAVLIEIKSMQEFNLSKPKPCTYSGKVCDKSKWKKKVMWCQAEYPSKCPYYKDMTSVGLLTKWKFNEGR